MEEQTIAFKDYYQINRSQIILAYENAKEVALKSYDEIALKLKEQLELAEKIKKDQESKKE